MKGKPERSSPPEGPPPLSDPLLRLITGAEESLSTRIEHERNTDHNGTLPSFCAMVEETLDLKDLFQRT
eukprot:8697873-Karenia_brevis.AAC.1